MKKLFVPIFAGAVLCCANAAACAQEFKTHVSKAFTVSGSSANTLSIYNREGSIKVEGYSGDKVMIEVDETISANNEDQLEKGKKEFKLEFEQDKDSIIAYIAEPYDSRPHQRWNYYDDRRIQYRYKLEFIVKVPVA